tara:strand:- start:127 stop:360 length:234 start_codon:yes stop_codon:yes gene_type:complete
MNTSTFLTALIIAIVFLLFKFLEMRFVLKENKPLKKLLKETLIVYLSVLGGDFVLQQIHPLQLGSSTPHVFTSPPDF